MFNFVEQDIHTMCPAFVVLTELKFGPLACEPPASKPSSRVDGLTKFPKPHELMLFRSPSALTKTDYPPRKRHARASVGSSTPLFLKQQHALPHFPIRRPCNRRGSKVSRHPLPVDRDIATAIERASRVPASSHLEVGHRISNKDKLTPNVARQR